MATNNKQGVQSYQKVLAAILPSVFNVQAAFVEAFGTLQVQDGVRENETAFSVKTNSVASALKGGGITAGKPSGTGSYNTGADVAFGSGTGNSTRFGERTEIIYQNADVPYTDSWNFHEGIDRFTVNNDLAKAVSDRLDLKAQALVKLYNGIGAKFLITNGTALDSTIASADKVTDVEIHAIFDEITQKFTDLEIVGQPIAYVTQQVYNAIIELPTVSTDKNSMVNIDNNYLVQYRGVAIKPVPAQYMTDGTNKTPIIATVANIAVQFTGINTARTIESEDFDGVALQGAGKTGTYVTDDNKKAIFKVVVK